MPSQANFKRQASQRAAEQKLARARVSWLQDQSCVGSATNQTWQVATKNVAHGPQHNTRLKVQEGAENPKQMLRKDGRGR